MTGCDEVTGIIAGIKYRSEDAAPGPFIPDILSAILRVSVSASCAVAGLSSAEGWLICDPSRCIVRWKTSLTGCRRDPRFWNITVCMNLKENCSGSDSITMFVLKHANKR